VAAGYATLLVGTPIALITYFNSGVAQSWHGPQQSRLRDLAQPIVESIAAVGLLGVLAYPATIVAISRLR
jgi:hypothetical protein